MLRIVYDGFSKACSQTTTIVGQRNTRTTRIDGWADAIAPFVWARNATTNRHTVRGKHLERHIPDQKVGLAGPRGLARGA